MDLITPEGIAVTFFYDDYRNLFPSINNEVIDLMDTRDIALNKAYLLNRRPKWRDYVDLYFLFQSHILSLKEMVNLAKKKFGSDFSGKLFLEQLVYWKDLDDYTVNYIGKEVSPETIKSFLEEETRKYTTLLGLETKTE